MICRVTDLFSFKKWYSAASQEKQMIIQRIVRNDQVHFIISFELDCLQCRIVVIDEYLNNALS